MSPYLQHLSELYRRYQRAVLGAPSPALIRGCNQTQPAQPQGRGRSLRESVSSE